METVFAEKEGSVVLDCLQRISEEETEREIIRNLGIAGDKFVLLASSECKETVLDQAERVFQIVMGKVHYQGNAVESGCVWRTYKVDLGDARSEAF